MLTARSRNESPDEMSKRLSRARVKRWVRETEKQLQTILTAGEWADYQRFKQAAENRAKRTWAEGEERRAVGG